MPIKTYQRIAGRNLDRLAALSDGVFAVVMTLLVLDLHVPVSRALHRERPIWSSGALQSEHVVWEALGEVAPSMLTYLMSFLILGIFWVGQQTQFNFFTSSNRNLTWIHLAFLLAVSLMPFSTALLAEYITFRLALVVYWLNLLLLGVLLFASIRYARRAGLFTEETTGEMQAAMERRIVVFQSLYAACVVLSVINTYVSIALILLLQLNAAVGPNIRPLNRF